MTRRTRNFRTEPAYRNDRGALIARTYRDFATHEAARTWADE